MKKKALIIFTLITFCAIFNFLFLYSIKPVAHKVLKVIEADELYIDLNNNQTIDNDELFRLKDIIAFRPIKNSYTIKRANELGIPIDDYLKNGFIAKDWAKTNLEGKYVYLLSKPIKIAKNPSYRRISIELNKEDVSVTLIKNGLATIDENCKNVNYLTNFSIKQIKNNAKEISKIKFYLVNLKNNIAHELNSDHSNLLNFGKLITSNELLDYIPCKICFKKIHIDIENEFIFPKSKRKYLHSISKKFGDLELFLINPYENNKPQDSCTTQICKRIVNEIDNSISTIDMALYGIGNQTEIINALKRAKERGVKIRSVVDFSKNMDSIYPNTSEFIKEFNSKTDKSEVIMHNKFFIFDNKKVLTGSTNISESGTGGYNNNSTVIVNSKELASQFKNEFEQMYNNKFSKSKLAQNTNKIITPYFQLKAYFLPKQNVLEEGILPLIKNAKDEIYVSIFYLTDKRIIEELINAKKRNVEVLVLIDATGANNFKDRIKMLRNAKIPTKIENWGGKNHEKVIMIDSNTLVIGSANFSKAGFNKNDENVLIITSPEIADFYKDYYLYLFNKIDNKFLRYFPRAEGPDSINSCNDGIDNNHDGKIDKEDEGCR